MTSPIRPLMLLLLALAACHSSTEPRASYAARFATNDTIYTASISGHVFSNPEYQFTVIASYFNPTPDTIFIDHCTTGGRDPLYAIELVPPSDTGSAAYNQIWGCAGTLDRGIPVAPLATFVDTLRLSGPNEWDSSWKPLDNAIAGRFRIQYPACIASRAGGCTAAPDSLRYSTPFWVTIPP